MFKRNKGGALAESGMTAQALLSEVRRVKGSAEFEDIQSYLAGQAGDGDAAGKESPSARQEGAPAQEDCAGTQTPGSVEAAALKIGLGMIASLAEAAGVSMEEAAALAAGSGGMIPSARESVSARAASDLAAMEKSGALRRDVQEYLAEPEFIKSLMRMPVPEAVRLADALAGSRSAEESLKTARSDGARDALEKLQSRRALPRFTRPQTPASGAADYKGMSDAEFKKVKERMRAQTAAGQTVSF